MHGLCSFPPSRRPLRLSGTGQPVVTVRWRPRRVFAARPEARRALGSPSRRGADQPARPAPQCRTARRDMTLSGGARLPLDPAIAGSWRQRRSRDRERGLVSSGLRAVARPPQAVTLTLPACGPAFAAGPADAVAELAGARGSVTCLPSALAAAVICWPRADRDLASAPCACSCVYLVSSWVSAACCRAFDAAEGFLARKLFGVAEIHFLEIVGTLLRGLLDHVLPGNFHPVAKGERVDRGNANNARGTGERGLNKQAPRKNAGELRV